MTTKKEIDVKAQKGASVCFCCQVSLFHFIMHTHLIVSCRSFPVRPTHHSSHACGDSLFSFTLFNQIRATNNWKIKRVHVRTFYFAHYCIVRTETGSVEWPKSDRRVKCISTRRTSCSDDWLDLTQLHSNDVSEQWRASVCGDYPHLAWVVAFYFRYVSFCVLTIYRLFVSILRPFREDQWSHKFKTEESFYRLFSEMSAHFLLDLENIKKKS